ncbi:hypothetical protein GCM10010428_74190 [Actinosynnema pretiosum subsp. pretiosum]
MTAGVAGSTSSAQGAFRRARAISARAVRTGSTVTARRSSTTPESRSTSDSARASSSHAATDRSVSASTGTPPYRRVPKVALPTTRAPPDDRRRLPPVVRTGTFPHFTQTVRREETREAKCADRKTNSTRPAQPDE